MKAFLGMLFACGVQAAHIPDNAAIGLAADKDSYFLGENILLHYCITNVGDKALPVDMGGDYRGGTRAERFKVHAFDAQGLLLTDPHPQQWNMGGLLSRRDLKPGEVWYGNVVLCRYRKFERPGKYRIEVFHDLGWGNRQDKDVRVKMIELTVKEPNAEDAKTVIAHMRKMLSYGGNSFGKKGQAAADFSLLTHPVYRDALEEIGDVHSVKSISGMPGIGSTKSLLRLMRRPDEIASAWAGYAIARRIPPSYGEAPMHGVGSSFWPHRRPPEIRDAWQSGFGKEARAIALDMLARTNTHSKVSAAGILMQVGNRDDLNALITAMDEVFLLVGQPVPKADRYSHPKWALQQLHKALEQFAKRGVTFIRAPQTPAEHLARIADGFVNTNASNINWVPVVQSALTHPEAVVREISVRRVPQGVGYAVLPDVITLMADPDDAVRRAACEIVNNGKHLGCREYALEAIRTSTDNWTIWMATDAAVRDGGRAECGRALADRFAAMADHPQYASMHVMRHLCRILVGGNMSGSWHFLRQPDGKAKAAAIRDAWKKLIEEHAGELENGVLPLGKKALPPELVPPGVNYRPAN